MAVSVRMGAALESELEAAAQRAGVTKSQFIIDAVERALGRKDAHSALMQVHRKYGIGAEAGMVREKDHAPSRVPSSAAYRQDLQKKHDADMRDWLAYHAARERGEKWVPDPPIEGTSP
jgi:predicted DNA-binding protein